MNTSELSPLGVSSTSGNSLIRRFLFRTGAVYLLIYNIDWMSGLLPGLVWAGIGVHNLWLALVPWVGKNVLGISFSFTGDPTGSGDKTFDYVQVFCYVMTAVAIGALWSFFDRERKRDATIHDLLRLSIRYVLAHIMLSYGWSKVFHLQMPAPGFGRLMEPYGESSPMGLLWTFMGFSTVYSMFAGSAEVLGGMLVLFRRTTTLGALVIFAVMLNVALMNFCFDVPAKLDSTHLVLMALFLMWPDLGRIADFFILNRTPPAIELGDTSCSVTQVVTWFPWIGPSFKRKLTRKSTVWVSRASLLLKVAVIGWLLYSRIHPRFERMIAVPNGSEFIGLYNIEKFSRNGESVPLLLTDQNLWQQLAVDAYGTINILVIRTVGATTVRFTLNIDPARHELKLTPRTAQAKPFIWKYQWAGDRLSIEGPYNGENISAELMHTDARQYLLRSRGFHWINEVPFNR